MLLAAKRRALKVKKDKINWALDQRPNKNRNTMLLKTQCPAATIDLSGRLMCYITEIT